MPHGGVLLVCILTALTVLNVAALCLCRSFERDAAEFTRPPDHVRLVRRVYDWCERDAA